MKNEYKETSPETLAMRESVTYYMQLTDYIMQEPAVVRYSYWRKREGLVKCTLLVTQKGDSVSFGKERKEVLIVRG